MNYDEKIKISVLVNSEPPKIVEWYERNSAGRHGIFFDFGWRRCADFILARRDNLSVKLAIARFGTHVPTLRKLYHAGDRVVQLATLTNPLVGPAGEKAVLGGDRILGWQDAAEILLSPTEEDAAMALLENRYIEPELISDLCQRDGIFDTLSSDHQATLVYHIANNEIITVSHSDTLTGGFSGQGTRTMFGELWSLFGKAPRDVIWARVLTKLAEQLADTAEAPQGANAVSIIEHWHLDSAGDPSRELTTPGLGDPVQDDDFWLRYTLAKRLHFVGKADSEDVAVRRGFYATCQPRDLVGQGNAHKEHQTGSGYQSGSAIQLMEACDKYLARDGEKFIEDVISNENFWKGKAERELLRDLAWGPPGDPQTTLDVTNRYRAKEASLEDRHPEWFLDEEDQGPEQETAGNLLRAVHNIEAKLDDAATRRANENRIVMRWIPIVGTALLAFWAGYLV
jgi:hypothetical protein